MNQILYNIKKNKKLKYIYKIQFIISITITIIIAIYIMQNYKNDKNLEKISKILNKNIELNSLYKTEKLNRKTNSYIGKIYIEKINLEYSIFSTFNEEILKVSPCRFYGVNIGEKGNICIAGHNYNDNRFFGKIDELEIKDKITLSDLEGKKYEYIVFNVFETDENDVSVLKSSKNFELTLVTCNNANKKRIIVKAYRKEY